jgi:hypothetical protein
VVMIMVMVMLVLVMMVMTMVVVVVVVFMLICGAASAGCAHKVSPSDYIRVVFCICLRIEFSRFRTAMQSD